MIARLLTIGVYGFTAERFLSTLNDARVNLLLDVRQRRGVRGPEYAWANSQRLQHALAQAGIGYRHVKELAPTTEMRAMQYAADAVAGEGKRSRTVLAADYVRAFGEQVLGPADLEELFGDYDTATVPALLCVERDAPACHRSLIAARLAADCGVRVEHLTPAKLD